MIIKRIYNIIIKIYFSLFIFIICSFVLKQDSLYPKYSHFIFDSNIDFQYIKSKSSFMLGSIVDNKEHYVSSSKLNVKNVKKKNNSYYLYLDKNYVINNQVAGIVTFIGEKEGLGETVIVSSDDGINYWYSGIENISVNLYDYIKASTIIGNVKNDYLILTLTKDNRYLNYEDYY